MDAQLGQMANVNLGGYIPAPARQPKIWQQVLAQFLGNVANQAGTAIVDRATSPDITKYDPVTQTAEEQPWYRRNFTPQEMVAMRGQSTNKTLGEQGMGYEGRKVKVAEDTGSAGVRASDAGIRQTDERLGQTGAQVALQGAEFAQRSNTDNAKLDLAKQELDLAKAKYQQTGSQFDRDLALRKEQQVMAMLGQTFNQQVEIGKLNLGAAESERANALLPYQQKSLEASAGLKDASAAGADTKSSGMLEDARVRAQMYKAMQIRKSDLSEEQKKQQLRILYGIQ